MKNLNLTVEAKNVKDLPVIETYCTNCSGGKFVEHKPRNILEFGDNAHIIYLKCTGECNKVMLQSWIPSKTEKGKFTFNRIHI